MKYCSKCRRMYDDSEHNCTECRKHYALETLDDRTTPVYLTSASGFELDRIQAALEDGGIPSTSQAQEKALSADAVTGSDKSNRDILVPFNALDKARDVCIGIGAIKPEGEEIKVEGQDVEDAVNSEFDESEIMSPAKRTAVKIISAILLIIIACLVIWGTDFITGFIKGLFN